MTGIVDAGRRCSLRVSKRTGEEAASPDRVADRLLEIYQRLYDHFGPLRWWPAETPLEVITGAVLTQNTAWTNVEKAIANLKQAGPLTREALLAMPVEELARLIRPSGYYNVKAVRLRALLEWLGEGWEQGLATGDFDALREDLLRVRGVGAETADSILLYAANRATFVIDAYTRRVLQRLGIEPGAQAPSPAPGGPAWGYEHYRRLFMDHLPHEPALFNEFHAQIVYLGKDYCRKQPRCGGCPLRDLCPTGSAAERM